MAAALSYEPQPRYLHVSETVGSKVLVQGGLTRDFSTRSQQHLATVVEIFDPYSELWEQRRVKGDAPSPGTRGAASAVIQDDLFIFGGRDGSTFFNTLKRLDTKTWSWIIKVSSDGAPMPKSACRMIPFRENLAVFGSFGIPQGPTEPQSFIKDTRSTDGYGWTNEFHIYHLNEGMFIIEPHFQSLPL